MSNSSARIMSEKLLGQLKAAHGDTCVNCGSGYMIEFHHIVPLSLGGSNAISNFAPLCYFCHKKIHGAHNMMIKARSENNGRPRKITPKSYEIFELYVQGFIGTSECKQRLGLSSKTHFTENKTYKEYLLAKGIKRVKNTIDLKVKKSGFVSQGDCVGYIEYLDTTKEIINHKKINDCESKPKKEVNPILKFLYGEIGEKELKTLYGFPDVMNIREIRDVDLWLQKYGVKTINNYVDIISEVEKIARYPGRRICEIIYDNERVEIVYYDWKLERAIKTEMKGQSLMV